MIRVSKERDDMTSPELQRTAIEDHCARRGYRVTRWIEGLDESGSRRKSAWWARLDEGVSLVETGDADVLVVWRFSRTARQRLKWAVAIDRVEVAGGLLESATEPLDTSTASGRLARGMLAEFAAYEAETIGAAWKETHARRTKAGLPANGKPRFGYRVQDGVHRPDPIEGPVLAALYRRYIAGESMYSLIGWLNAEGYQTVPGYSKRGPGPWTQTALRRCLDTGFGAGFITVHAERERGIHEPVIDPGTWEAYLAARAARRTHRRSERSTYLLSGMLRCHYLLEDGSPCGSPMGGGQFGWQRTPKFRCIATAAERRHIGGYVTMAVVEDELRGWLARVESGEINPTTDRKRAGKNLPDLRRLDVDAIGREILALDKQLATATRQHLREVIPEAAYLQVRDEIEEAKRVLEERHAQALAAVRASVDSCPIAAQLLEDWDDLLVPERRAILRKLVDHIEVVPGRPRSTVRVVGLWPGG